MKEKILEKIKKLQALANCQTGNPNETANAAVRMMELMLQYEIAESDLLTEEVVHEDELISKEIDEGGRFGSWEKMLLLAVSKASLTFAVQKIVRNKGSKFILSGRTSRVEFGTFLYRYLHQQIFRLGQGRGASFRLGCAETVYRRLTRVFEEEKTGQGLVLSQNAEKEAEQFYLKPGDKVKEAKMMSFYDRKAYEQGKKVGEYLDISPKGGKLGASQQKALTGH